MEDVVDYILFDYGSGVDWTICICGVKGETSFDALEYLESSAISKIDALFRIGIRCFWRIYYLWIQFVFSTNIPSQFYHCTSL
jgi:hypothetical protein